MAMTESSLTVLVSVRSSGARRYTPALTFVLSCVLSDMCTACPRMASAAERCMCTAFRLQLFLPEPPRAACSWFRLSRSAPPAAVARCPHLPSKVTPGARRAAARGWGKERWCSLSTCTRCRYYSQKERGGAGACVLQLRAGVVISTCPATHQ